MTQNSSPERSLHCITTMHAPSWRLDFAEKLEKVGEENSVKVDVYIPLEAKEESAQTIIDRDLDMIQRVDLCMHATDAILNGCV